MGDLSIKYVRVKNLTFEGQLTNPNPYYVNEAYAIRLEKSGKVEILDKKEIVKNGKIQYYYNGVFRNPEPKIVRKVIYTAIFGDKDLIPDYKYYPEGWHYILFTDNPMMKSDKWQIRLTNKNYGDPVRCARELKHNPHKILNEYDVSVWVDANIIFKIDFDKYFTELADQNKYVLLKHWQDVKGPYHECERCIQLNKDNQEIINSQAKAYRALGVPENLPVEWTALIIRNHKDRDVITFQEELWSQIKQYSRRDQIAFPYIAWKMQLKYKTIPGFGDLFIRKSHKCKLSK